MPASNPAPRPATTTGQPQLKEWIERTREMLCAAYPGQAVRWASLVVNLGEDVPYTTLVVIPDASASSAESLQ